MKSLPFVAPYYNNQIVPRHSMTMCKEFDGDCFQFVKKYKKYEWFNQYCESPSAKCTEQIFESHVCTAEEIT